MSALKICSRAIKTWPTNPTKVTQASPILYVCKICPEIISAGQNWNVIITNREPNGIGILDLTYVWFEITTEENFLKICLVLAQFLLKICYTKISVTYYIQSDFLIYTNYESMNSSVLSLIQSNSRRITKANLSQFLYINWVFFFLQIHQVGFRLADKIRLWGSKTIEKIFLSNLLCKNSVLYADFNVIWGSKPIPNTH